MDLDIQTLSYDSINDVRFDIEDQLEEQLILRPSFTAGIDSIIQILLIFNRKWKTIL